MYLVNRTCVDCGNRYSYSNETPPELKDCPYCVALEQIASNVRDARELGLPAETALALVEEAEWSNEADEDYHRRGEWQPPSVADDAALEAEQDYLDNLPDEPQGQHRHPNG